MYNGHSHKWLSIIGNKSAQGTLPGGEHWIRLLFVMLFLLGIDSAFSFLEGFLTVLADTKAFSNVDRKITSFVLTTVAFLLSLMYATDSGLIFLDAIDYYINLSCSSLVDLSASVQVGFMALRSRSITLELSLSLLI
jgi:SNF family Na+-dependent transporter